MYVCSPHLCAFVCAFQIYKMLIQAQLFRDESVNKLNQTEHFSILASLSSCGVHDNLLPVLQGGKKMLFPRFFFVELSREVIHSLGADDLRDGRLMKIPCKGPYGSSTKGLSLEHTLSLVRGFLNHSHI